MCDLYRTGAEEGQIATVYAEGARRIESYGGVYGDDRGTVTECGDSPSGKEN